MLIFLHHPHHPMLLFLVLLHPLSTLPATITPTHCQLSSTTLSPSTTIPADCQRLEGRFRVDGTTRLSDSQLSQLFANVREIVGVVQIWSSELSTANFLGKVQRISGDLLEKSLSVRNNSLLTSLNISSLEQADGKVEIQNNPLLDLKPSCAHLHKAFFNRRSISSTECGCELPAKFQWPTVRDFPKNCIVLYGNFVMKGPAASPEVLYRLLSAQKLYGYLDVDYSNLETLGFLQNLQEIESGPQDEYTIRIGNMNNYMARLDLIQLRSIVSQNPLSQVSIEGNPCLDPAFVQLLAHSAMKAVFLRGSFCPLNRINNPSFYCSGNLSTVSDRCTRYIGNLLYFHPDGIFWFQQDWNATVVPEKEWKKIQNFEYIFGSLMIEGSAMKTLSLPALQEIYQIDNVISPTGSYSHSIFISHNYNLTEVSLPRLEYSYGLVRFDNNERLDTGDAFCRGLTVGREKVEVGTSGDYDCRPYLSEPPESTTESV